MMRSILVDWLVEVQESFELNHETLYTAIKLMDIFMSKKFVCKEDLQLVGATAALIACKVQWRHIQMRAAKLLPSPLCCPYLWWKERGKIGISHLNETFSFE